MKKILTKTIELINFVFLNIFVIAIWILIWQIIPWFGIVLLIFIAPILIYEAYKFFKEIHQSNLNDIQEELNIAQDIWIEDISDRIRNNWDLNRTKVTPYNKWGCRIYIQQDKYGNVLETEIQECTIRDKRKANSIKKSLIKAVFKTSPLPMPEDDKVFVRQIFFNIGAH